MSTKINSFIVFLSLIPIWYFKLEIYKVDILFFSIFLIIFFFLILIILNKLTFLNNKIYYYFFLSMIIYYGLDNHFGFHLELTNSYSILTMKLKDNIYLASLIVGSTIFITIFLFILLLKENGIKILSVFIVTIALFSIIDNSKSIKNLKNFDNAKQTKFNKPKLVFVFDETSGIGGFESSTKEGQIFDKNIKKLSKENELQVYEKIYTHYKATTRSLTSLLNFKKIDNFQKYLDDKLDFFSHYNLKKNKFFDIHESVAVHQSVHMNFCDHKNVTKCKDFHPFEKKKYIEGFKNTKFTNLVNAWKLDGSITSLFVWRILRQFNLINVNLSPQGEKGALIDLLDQALLDLHSKKYDLIFVHTLVPHKPYGFNKKCEYDGKRSLGNYRGTMSIENHTYQHNIERICLVSFLDIFFKKLEAKKIKFDKILFLSDHGSRNQRDNYESNHNVLFILKNAPSEYRLIKEKKFSQDEFKKIFKDY
jgi:hypothetical protein